MENQEIITFLERIDRKLSVITGDIMKKRTSSINEQVQELSLLRMPNPEIAEILGISASHVAKEKSVSKSKKKGKK